MYISVVDYKDAIKLDKAMDIKIEIFISNDHIQQKVANNLLIEKPFAYYVGMDSYGEIKGVVLVYTIMGGGILVPFVRGDENILKIFLQDLPFQLNHFSDIYICKYR